MKRVVLGFAAAGMLLLTGGCYFKDIDKRLFVTTIGVDPGQDGDSFRVFLKVAIPMGDPKQGEEIFDIISVESPNISEALRMAKSRVDKELDYSHAKVVVLGEGLSGKQIRHVTHWAFRRRDIQKIAWVAVGRPNAYRVLEVKPKSERIPSNSLILPFGETGTESPYIISVPLFVMERRMEEPGIDPILPVVKADGDNFQIDHAVLFGKKEAVGMLNPEEVKLLKMMHNEAKGGTFSAEVNGSSFGINVDHVRSSYKIEHSNPSAVTVRVRLQVRGTMEEDETEKLLDRAVIAEVEKAIKEKTERQCVALLEKLRGLEVDPVGFGIRYFSRNWDKTDEEARWKRLYASAKFEVNAQINIHSTGNVR